MPELVSRLRKNETKRIVVNNSNADQITDADIHSWIDAGELITA